MLAATRLLRVCLSLALTARHSAAAQQIVKVMSGAQMRMLHMAMDTGGDALVSTEEAATFVRGLRTSLALQQVEKIHEAMDTSKDGMLSLDELTDDLQHFRIDDAQKRRFADSFSSFDDNGDALLSPEEALALFNFMFPFQKLDTNQDGALSRREFKQIAAPKLQHAPQAERDKSDIESKAIFASLDADGSKKLDAKEYFVYESGIYAALAALDKLFDLADTNADQQLSAEELVEVRQHQGFGGSAAYHHAQDWINKIEEAVKQVEAAKPATKPATKQTGGKAEL